MAKNIYETVLEKYSLDELAKGPLPVDSSSVITPMNLVDSENYLLLEAHTHSSYSYPDLLVAKSLSHHDKSWQQCHEALHAEGFEMLTPRQFVDFLNLLKSGRAFDGRGNKVSSSELEIILKEITEQRAPWRAEWLDAKFEKKKDRLHVNYEHRSINGKITAQKSEPLANYPAKDKTPGISLDDYLQRATLQGMPPADVKSGGLYYWSPANGLVARFGAGAGRVDLGCRGGPQNSGAALGVRRRRAKN